MLRTCTKNHAPVPQTVLCGLHSGGVLLCRAACWVFLCVSVVTLVSSLHVRSRCRCHQEGTIPRLMAATPLQSWKQKRQQSCAVLCCAMLCCVVHQDTLYVCVFLFLPTRLHNPPKQTGNTWPVLSTEHPRFGVHLPQGLPCCCCVAAAVAVAFPWASQQLWHLSLPRGWCGGFVCL
jgi:hypothetical protein